MTPNDRPARSASMKGNNLLPKSRTDLTRRAALGGLAVVPISAAVAAEPGATQPSAAPGACVLTPEAVEGPFYFDPALVRSDITEGLPGVPLELKLVLSDASTCAALDGVRVDVWHADATGAYSGYDGMGPPAETDGRRATFMRGTQFADRAGSVAFRTIYPGWYPGRTPHVHVKAFVDGRSVLTTQVYFPDALSEYIYDNVPAYRGREGARDTVNTTDAILARTGNARVTFAAVREQPDRYVAELAIAVDRRGAPAPRRPGSGPDGPPPPDGRRGPPPGPPPGGREGDATRARPRGPLVPGERG